MSFSPAPLRFLICFFLQHCKKKKKPKLGERPSCFSRALPSPCVLLLWLRWKVGKQPSLDPYSAPCHAVPSVGQSCCCCLVVTVSVGVAGDMTLSPSLSICLMTLGTELYSPPHCTNTQTDCLLPSSSKPSVFLTSQCGALWL